MWLTFILLAHPHSFEHPFGCTEEYALKSALCPPFPGKGGRNPKNRCTRGRSPRVHLFFGQIPLFCGRGLEQFDYIYKYYNIAGKAALPAGQFGRLKEERAARLPVLLLEIRLFAVVGV